MTAPYWQDEQITLHLGDCIEVLAGMAAGSVDAIVTDPPYGLEFMGRDWDSFKPSGARIRRPSERDRQPGMAHNASTSLVTRNQPEAYVAGQPYQAWCEAWAAECLRVLKPGGYLLAFGGTRTWHRLACAIEDAGFQIRDTVADLTGVDGPGLLWANGQGFPKSKDVSKAIDAELGADRPVVGEHPAPAANKPGGSSLNMSAVGMPAVVPLTASATAAAAAAAAAGWGTALKPAWEPVVVGRKPLAGTVARNYLDHGTGALNIDGCRIPVADEAYARNASGDRGHADNRTRDMDFAMTAGHASDGGRWPPNLVLGEEAAAEMDRQSGVLTSGANPERRRSDKFRDAYGEFAGQEECTAHRGADSGGASRFFPVFRYEAKAGSTERPRGNDGTAHPTVKPVGLMRWLVRLVTPPGGLVLDLFAGSGTTAEACIVEGFRCVLIEKDPSSCGLIRKRLSKDIQPVMFGGAA